MELHNGPLDVKEIFGRWLDEHQQSNYGAFIPFVGIIREEGGIEALSFDIYEPILRSWFDAWQIRASPNVTIDWEADSGNKLTLPIAIGLGKMLKIGPMPVMLMAEYQYSVIAPDRIGNESTIMLQVNFIIKNPFADQ